MYAVKYNNEILSEAELIERIRLADVMTDMLYTKDKIMKSESDSYNNSVRNSYNLTSKFGNLSNAKMSLQLKTELSRYLTDISIGKFNNKPSYMSNSPMYKYFTKFRPYSYFKTIDLVLGVPEQIGYYKDLLSKMENDKEFLARYEKITGGILPLQDWFLAKPSAKMTNAAITVVTDLMVHGGFKIATSWLMRSVASTSMYLIASGALNQDFIEDLSDSGFVPDVFSTMLMSMVFFMEMLRFRDTNEKDLTKGDKVLESASRRNVEKGVGTLLGAGSQMVMQQIIGGIYYSGGMADKLDYSAKKSMEDRNKYVITNAVPGITEAIEASAEYKKAQEYEAKQNKANAIPVVLPPPPPPDDNAKKPRTNTKSVRKNNNNEKKPRK
jgi:predicted lactoylglutathione lyase